MNYDGTTPVSIELARLYGFSPKSSVKVAAAMAEARTALVLGNGKRLTPQQNMAILQYHQGVKGVEDNSQAAINGVEDISQPYPDDKLIRMAFYTVIDGTRKRQVIALHGFMFNALMVALGSADKQDVPKWLNNQAFIGGKPITLQAQQSIVRALLPKAAL